MIQVFKLTSGLYDHAIPPLFKDSTTGLLGHNKKLFIEGCNKDLRKYAFSMRSARIWNSLPVKTINATDVKNFERALDRHWEDQGLLFDNFEAEITLKSIYNT